jgi:hypothetical protein
MRTLAFNIYCMVVALGTVSAHPDNGNDFSLQAGKAEIQFTSGGLLRSIRLETHAGWRKTAAAGSVLSGRRKGEWYVRCGDKATWMKPETVAKKGNVMLLNCRGEDADLAVEWSPVFEDAFLVTCRLTAKKDLPSATIGLDMFNLPPEAVKATYCLSHSLPGIRNEEGNNIPVGFIGNDATLNNTFSLITGEGTFSLSVLTPQNRRTILPDSEAGKDYWVGFKPGTVPFPFPPPLNGSITLMAHCHNGILEGESVVRQFLIAAAANASGVSTTGLHIGQYMALVSNPHRTNLLELYRKSMGYLLDDSCCFVTTPKHGKGFWGAVHSGTGEGYGNGRAFYAMYGCSFSVAAFTQYAAMNGQDPRRMERLQEGPARFLTATDVLTPEGAYWSMLDVDKGALVDQANRNWLETHATGWIAYFLLRAYEISGDDRFLDVATKNLKWLASVQNSDGSFPKYFENGKPSTERQGDLAWNALTFLKANEMGVAVLGEDLRGRGVLAMDWLLENPVKNMQYFGSFEDVGGVIESYSSSVSAHALMAAYRLTGNTKYLQGAKAALSVSLAWITCDYCPIGQPENSWNIAKAIRPAYAQVESAACYYACSYTLPMMYVAASEVAAATQGAERNYWLQIVRQFSQMDVFFSDIAGTKARFGMEWLTAPFLVFPEWGNAQTCWAIMETLRQRASIAVPSLKLDCRMQGTINGKRVSVIAPKWDNANGNLLDLDPQIDPLVLRAEDGSLRLLLLAEGVNLDATLALKALAASLGGNSFAVINVESGQILGTYTMQQLRKGIPVTVSGHLLLELNPAEGRKN